MLCLPHASPPFQWLYRYKSFVVVVEEKAVHTTTESMLMNSSKWRLITLILADDCPPTGNYDMSETSDGPHEESTSFIKKSLPERKPQ